MNRFKIALPGFRYFIVRLCLAAPIALLVGAIRLYLDQEQSSLIGFITGLVAFAIADFILCGRTTRKARLKTAKNFAIDNLPTALITSLMLVITIAAYSNRHVPEVAIAQQVQSMVDILGLLTVFLIPMFHIVSFTPTAALSAASMVKQLIWGVTAYSCALWVIGAVGDDVYHWSLANPTETVALAISLMICWAILNFSLRPSNVPTYNHGYISAKGVLLRSREATTRDKQYIAAHEAGHALVYAALGGLPSYVKVSINDQPDDQGVLGSVTGISNAHLLEEKSFAEWRMLVCLAGKLGETVIHGESTLGSRNDHQMWVSIARVYLANHYQGMFYDDPQNKFEHEQNEHQLEKLQEEQVSVLRKFFNCNSVVFKELVSALLENRSMAREDLYLFLNRVTLPGDIPRPFGHFAHFSKEWPWPGELDH